VGTGSGSIEDIQNGIVSHWLYLQLVLQLNSWVQQRRNVHVATQGTTWEPVDIWLSCRTATKLLLWSNLNLQTLHWVVTEI